MNCICCHLDLGLPASTTVRNQCLRFEPPSLGYLVTAAKLTNPPCSPPATDLPTLVYSNPTHPVVGSPAQESSLTCLLSFTRPRATDSPSCWLFLSKHLGSNQRSPPPRRSCHPSPRGHHLSPGPLQEPHSCSHTCILSPASDPPHCSQSCLLRRQVRHPHPELHHRKVLTALRPGSELCLLRVRSRPLPCVPEAPGGLGLLPDHPPRSLHSRGTGLPPISQKSPCRASVPAVPFALFEAEPHPKGLSSVAAWPCA